MSKEPDFSVTVILVNYNGGDYIQAAVDHLRTQTSPPDEIIVVDNNSADGSADRLKLQGLDQARLIRLEENTGFAAANNLAARQAKGTWLALLNPDTEPQENWLEELASATRRYPSTTSFASTQIGTGEGATIDGTGDCYSIYGFPWRGGFGASQTQLPAEGECFSTCGASALIRKDTFLDAGGFDESYFCYCEDVDLGYRLRLAGERCIFIPTAIVYHHGSAITGRYSDFTVRLGTRNRLTTYLKNTPPVLLALTLPVHLAMTGVLYLAATGQPKARSIRTGFTAGVKQVRQTMAARRKLQKKRRLSSLAIAHAMSWNPLNLVRRAPHVWPVSDTPPPAKPRAGVSPDAG